MAVTSDATAAGTKKRPATIALSPSGPWIHCVITNCAPNTREEQRRHGGGAPQEARVASGGGVDQRTVRTRFVPGERDEQEHTDQRRAHHQRREPAELRAFDDGQDHRGERAPPAAARSGCRPRGDSGSRDAGTHHAARTSVTSTMGTLTRNTEPHQKCASNSAADDGTGGGGDAGDPGPHRDRLAAFLLRKDVADRGQRRRHRARATDAHQAPGHRQRRGRVGEGGRRPTPRRRS